VQTAGKYGGEDSTNFDITYILMVYVSNSKRKDYEVIHMRTQSGHRQRTKERFRKEGLDSFEEVHALELLLCYAIPRKDTKPIARQLLDRFGSFAKVLEATPEALMQVDGIGVNAAGYIKLLHETGRYYLVSRDEAPTVLSDLNACGYYLVKFFHGKREEAAWVLCLDAKCKLLCCQKISEGGLDAVSVSPRRAAEVALSVNATSVILAHNHPGGLATPSQADTAVTYRIALAMSAMDIVLADHIIVSENDFISMFQSGYYDPKKVAYL